VPARKITLLALVLAMLLGTLLVTWAAVRDERARADSRGQQAASDGAGFLTLDLASATTSLNDAAGFVVGSTSVTPADFDAYGRQVLGFSSLSAMAWVERVTDAQRDRFEARLRTITEPTGQGGVRVAARRSVYFPVTLRAVEKATIGTLGGDLGIDLPHRATIERALATGAMALSEPLVLRPDGTIGVVMYQPVYAGGVTPTTPGGRSRKLLGIASASFALSELLPDVEAAARPGLRVQVVYEGQVLPLGERPLRGGHRAVVASGGRTFVVVAQTPSISMLLPIVTLAGGIALTSMVCLLFLVLIRRDRRQQRAIVAATRDLRASRESHRALTENSPDVVMRCDLGGRCLYANPAIEQITGMPAEHYVGRTLSEVGLPEAAAAALHGALEQVRATHQVADLDFDLGVSGQTRSFHSLIAPEIGLDGEIASILVVARDVSEQRRAQSELRRSRDYSAALVASLHDGLCVLDADGRLVA
jgi:PAS domain S-box-containing protein